MELGESVAFAFLFCEHVKRKELLSNISISTVKHYSRSNTELKHNARRKRNNSRE
jgi:hypothetical protein